MSETNHLSSKVLRTAVEGSACALRCRTRLQPAGGEGDKVFPPTYAGAVYAREQRRVPGCDEPVQCVLLDSVQSQANRMEEALQAAVDEKRLRLLGNKPFHESEIGGAMDHSARPISSGCENAMGNTPSPLMTLGHVHES